MHITSKRLVIRPLIPTDIPSLQRINAQADTMRYIQDGSCYHSTEALENKYSSMRTKTYRNTGMLAVLLKDSGNVIGEAGLFNSFGRESKLELGYIIDSTQQRQGYGRELCQALISYSFDRLNVQTLVARMYADNVASVALAESCGMTQTKSDYTAKQQKYLVFEITKK